MMNDKPFVLAGKEFESRLMVGTGKYPDFPTMKAALVESGAEIVTVALRRVDLADRGENSFFAHLPKNMLILPNTAGCTTMDEAIRTCYLARELGLGPMVKIEVFGDMKTLYPDTAGLIEASKILIKDGFVVLPYTNDDPIVARRLEEIGCAAIMPLAAPIGSGLGIRNPFNIKMIIDQASVPVIVDAGVGTASDAAMAMELGADAVLMNTAIAEAKNPVMMAKAMRLGIEAGRAAFLAGRMPKRAYASASSPLSQLIE